MSRRTTPGGPRRGLSRRAVALAAPAGLAFLASCERGAGEAAPTYFEGRLDDWARELLADDPERATAADVPVEAAGGRYQHRLTDRSTQALERRRSAALRRRVEARALDPASLDAAQTYALKIVQSHFEAAAETARFSFGQFDPLGGVTPYVLAQSGSAFTGLPAFLETQHGIADREDAEAYLERLAAVPGALDAEVTRAQADARAGVVAPDFILARARALIIEALGAPTERLPYVSAFLAKLDGLAQPEASEAPAEPMAPQDRARLEARAQSLFQQAILPAYQRTEAALAALAAQAGPDAGVWRLPEGEAYYGAALAYECGVALTAEELHRIGREATAEIAAALDQGLRRQGLTQGGVGERMAALTADPAHAYPNTPEGRAALLSDVRARIDAVMAKAPTWFGAMPRAALEVRPVPPLQEPTAPGAYYLPPSLSGDRPGIYFINLRDTGEMTRIDLPTQDYHEAAPGHHFQIAIAQEQGQTPLLRRLMSFTAYTEGWAVYAEQLADEQGLHESDPIGRLGYLRWRMWRAARLVVDTGLHSLRWTRAEAAAYLQEVTGDHPAVIESEVDRYVVTPGQACAYEIGRREIGRLRDSARRALGPAFDLRSFHDAVLGGGEAPLGVLGETIDTWRAERSQRG